MTRRIARLAASLLALAVVVTSAPALAQNATKKTAPRKPARPAATAPVVAPLQLPPAQGEQVAAASLAYFGPYECEFGETVVLSMNPTFDAYIDITHRKRVYTMKPVLSHTGAIRLEDVRGQMLMIQIASKSMLMDTRLGQRVVDGCQSEKQRHHVATMAASEGIGIDPAKPVPAAGASGTAVASTAPATTPAPPVAATPPGPAAPAAAAPAAPPASAPPAAPPATLAPTEPAAPAAPTPSPAPAAPTAPAPASSS